MPENKFFSLPFPQWIKLAPGNKFFVEVTFRPIKYEEYFDEITVNTKSGGYFKVPISARIAKIAVDVPKSLTFPDTPVNETSTVDLILDNVGQLDAPFEFDYKSPFNFEPSEGIVPVNQKIIIKVSYSPITADYIKGKAVCIIDKGRQNCPILLDGFGHYPFMKMSEKTLDFGECYVYLYIC